VISLRRLNGSAFVLNADLIEQIESTPDTVITLTTGNNIIVKESLDEVIERIVAYRRRVTQERDAGQRTLVERSALKE
jgi:flagellar protein FlbD